MAPALTKAGIGLNFSKRTDGTPILAMITVSKPGVRLNGKGEVGFNESEIRAAMGGSLVSGQLTTCLLYTSPSPRDRTRSRMPSSA